MWERENIWLFDKCVMIEQYTKLIGNSFFVVSLMRGFKTFISAIYLFEGRLAQSHLSPFRNLSKIGSLSEFRRASIFGGGSDFFWSDWRFVWYQTNLRSIWSEFVWIQMTLLIWYQMKQNIWNQMKLKSPIQLKGAPPASRGRNLVRVVRDCLA